MSLTREPKTGDKSVEITVLVELFSTFFEKITFSHPEKDVLMKNLAKFKAFLYGNQQTLEKGHDFLQQMNEQYLSYLREQQPQQQGGSTSSLPFNSNTTNEIGSNNSQPGLNQFSQQQQQQIQQSSQQQGRPSFSSNQQALRGNIVASTSNSNQKSNRMELQSFRQQTLSQQGGATQISGGTWQFHATSELNSIQLNLNQQYSSYRDYEGNFSENAFFICVGYRYFEQLIRQSNLSKIQQLFKYIQSNELSLDSNEYKQSLLSLLTYISDSMTAANNTSNSSNLNNISSGNTSSQQEQLEFLSRGVSESVNLVGSLSQFVRAQTIKFIRESDPRYIAFLLQSSKISNQQELLDHMKATNEPVEIAVNIVALALEQQINMLIIDYDNSLSGQTYKYNSLPSSHKQSIDLLKVKVPSVKYSLLYSQQEAALLSNNNTNNNNNINNNNNNNSNVSGNNLMNNNNTHNKSHTESQDATSNISKKTRNSKTNPLSEINKVPQMEDFKSRGGFLKKMFKIFDDNTEDLILKMNNFKNGYDEDDEEDGYQENIEKVLKEHINSSKSRQLNFYSNVQNQNTLWAQDSQV